MPVLSKGFAFPAGAFYEGGGIAPTDLVPAQYPVAIAGRPYNIEPKLYRLSHIPLRREARDDQAEPGETSLNPAGLWRRSQSDWSLGAGQVWLDEQESTRRRFNTSLGVDVFNDRELTLLPETEEKRNSANTNLKLLEVGTRLYVVDGATLIFSNGSGSEQNATWVTGWTTATGLPGGNILDIAYSGNRVYVLGSDNSIYRATAGTQAFALYYNPVAVATRMFTGLGRLFISDNRSLYEVTATPGETLIFTHPDPDYVITTGVGAPSGIYFAGNVGSDFGEIRHTWVNDAGTALVAPVVAAELLSEQVFTVKTAGNNLCFGTSVGFRYARIDNLATGLDFGPAVEVGPVRDMAVEAIVNRDTGRLDTFAWFTWTSIHGGAESGLGRIRLTRQTEPGVLAYASDIYSTAGGTVLCVASVGGRRYFGVSTDGFKGATSNYVAEGELRTGRIRYGVLDNKTFNDIAWRTAPISGLVSADLEFDDGATAHAGDQTAESSTGVHAHFGPSYAEWAEIIFTIGRGGVITPALFFNGQTGSASTPDHANFAVTDLDVEWTGALENWTPGGSGDRILATASFATTVWDFFINEDGKIGIKTSPDGTGGAALTRMTSTAPELELGSEHTIGVTVDVNNGAGGRTYNFLVDGTLFETFTEAGTTSIFNGTNNITIGFSPFSPVGGSYTLRFTMRASIGGAAVANPDFTLQTVGASSFADTAPTPKTWTVNTPASIALVNEAEDLTPRLRWWVLRAIPAVEETVQILVPLRLHGKEQTPLGPAKAVSFLEELDFLLALDNSKQIVKYQEGSKSYDVYINNIEVNPEYWNGMDHGLEGIVMVELHTAIHP